jgi:hypothetical protein
VDERSERVARRFELPVLIAALLVIPVIVVEQSDWGDPWKTLAASWEKRLPQELNTPTLTCLRSCAKSCVVYGPSSGNSVSAVFSNAL